ncbi:MAG: tRNA preQ1(34) S-adenosylmethionine ribosyltransferase-isomerase QueA [Firmicutes bacterium]|nr:tRNA preQ1(34) S-adenosylmethionine ribosyltransferase-isomerase QueA [Bacillota bacterium]
MKVEDFNYELPEERIAQDPVEPRDASRLMVMDRQSGKLEHRIFRDILDELHAGDILVINDTKVLPARIYAHKETGAVIELLLLKQVEADVWQCLVKPGKKALPGAKLLFDLPELSAEVLAHSEEGSRLIRFNAKRDFFELLDRLGTMPLPPYIKKPLEDQSRYQPVYARERGSAAAPTAGLHFTDSLLAALSEKGVGIAKVLLHVGLGTFRPVKAETVEEHVMHSEFYRVTEEAASAINRAKAAGGRVIAVGTTAVRTLETVSAENGEILPGEGWTQKYIYPGYRYKAIDGMITNFHLPKSSLIMLVSAFAGKENVLRAYETAVEEKYRFFSFGDAMFIR